MASMNKSPKKRFGLGDIIIFGIILIAIIFIFAGSCGGNKAKTIETKEEFYGYFFKNASDGAAVYNDLSQLDKDKLISAQDLQIERIYYYHRVRKFIILKLMIKIWKSLRLFKI